MTPADTLIRPFTIADLPPMEPALEPRSPDFVGVGAPKCGTSWWYRLLTAHPEIRPHRLFTTGAATSKELHYFHHFAHRGMTPTEMETYRSAFASPKDKLCGEFTTRYMAHPGCLELLRDLAPQTHILVMLRDPVERTISHINHLWRHRRRRFGLEGDEATLFRLYSVDMEALGYSLYADALARLLRLFPREQVLVLQYEACRAQPQRELARCFTFLGVDPGYLPPAIRRPVNRTIAPLPPVSERYRDYLRNYFREDVTRTLALVPTLDPALWPGFT